MAGYVCPCCGEISDIFSKGGGQEMAQKEGVGWLGRVPIDTKLVKLLDDVVKGSVENVTPEQPGDTVYVPTRPEDTTSKTSPRPSDASDKLRRLDVSENQSSDARSTETDASADSRSTQQRSFPLLDLYMETTSSKVWKDITDGVLRRIKERGEEMANTVRQ
ncbi:hypothetical protein QFC19_002513 [Naganishia cerealis]|uniref:Uncharacterized protein n=1 Tax=Naganishia cerealis TaxID=610337 RepID=A0ACC2W926_9TREE|nr:hypothetical protein QFC19_002513 [Naganishia cerealis]